MERVTLGTNDTAWDKDELRTRFSMALSDMYRHEVPLYGDLIHIVREVDSTVLNENGQSLKDLPVRNLVERHGAIRLGSESELHVIKRLFAVFGMYPVGYYDLRIVDFPLHATAFRPVTEESLEKNPFRVFTSVLRKDLLSPHVCDIAERVLEKRSLFSPLLLDIIQRAEEDMPLTAQDADDLIAESLKIFNWHSRSTVEMDEYLELKQEHPLVADIVSFPSAHINHLTPRTLDIDLVQREMIKRGLPAKERVEGPPIRLCPVLLRQTSFKALEEFVLFPSATGDSVKGTHTARFGEVEQRGAAVTRKGRDLYDQLLRKASEDGKGNPIQFEEAFVNAFSVYPDDWSTLRKENLVYFRYVVSPVLGQYKPQTDSTNGKLRTLSMQYLLESGQVEMEPLTYEDFLPLSAAGIFNSNLGSGFSNPKIDKSGSGLPLLETALGCAVLNEFDLYEELQERSIRECAKALGLEVITLD